MADIRCPMCGKNNPAGTETCRFCNALILPQGISNPGAQSSQNTDQPSEGASPDWLNALRGGDSNVWGKNGDAEKGLNSGFSGGTDLLARVVPGNLEKNPPNSEPQMGWGNIPTLPADTSSGGLSDEPGVVKRDEPVGSETPSTLGKPDGSAMNLTLPQKSPGGDHSIPAAGMDGTGNRLNGQKGDHPSPGITEFPSPGQPAEKKDDNQDWLEQLKAWREDESPAGNIPIQPEPLTGQAFTISENLSEPGHPPTEDDNMDWLKQFSDLGVSTGGVESKELKQDQPVVDGGIADRFETNDAETGEWLKNLMDGQPGVAGPGDEALNVETQFPDGNPHAITPPIETYPSVESDAFDIKEISPQRVDQASLIINDQVDINPDESAGLPDWLSGLGQSAAVEGYVGGAVTVDSKSSTGVDIPDWLHAFQSDQTPPDNEGGLPFPEISTTENNDLPPGNDGVNNPVKPGKTVDIPAESPGGELPDWLTGLIQPVDLDKQPQENEEVQAFSDPASQFAKPGGVIQPEVDENTTRNKGLVSLAMETFFYDGMELPYWLADFYQQSGAQGPAASDIQPPENGVAKFPGAGLQGSADSETKEKEQ